MKAENKKDRFFWIVFFSLIAICLTGFPIYLAVTQSLWWLLMAVYAVPVFELLLIFLQPQPKEERELEDELWIIERFTKKYGDISTMNYCDNKDGCLCKTCQKSSIKKGGCKNCPCEDCKRYGQHNHTIFLCNFHEGETKNENTKHN